MRTIGSNQWQFLRRKHHLPAVICGVPTMRLNLFQVLSAQIVVIASFLMLEAFIIFASNESGIAILSGV